MIIVAVATLVIANTPIRMVDTYSQHNGNRDNDDDRGDE